MSPNPASPRGRVLLLSNFLGRRTGIPTVAEQLAPRLIAAGWRVTTASPLAARPLRLLHMLAIVFARRRAYDGALVEVYSGAAFRWAQAAAWALRQVGRPYVAALHGGRLPELAARHPARLERLLTGAAAVTAPSPHLATALRPHHDGIEVVPNPLDLGRYPFRLRQPARPRLVWLRAFHPIYEPGLAVEVAARLVPRYPDLALRMIGPIKDPACLGELRTSPAAAALGDRLEIVGPIAKTAVPGALAEADVFLNTSRVDNAPVTLTEALACGLPAVTTAAGGIPQLVADGVEALLAPPGDAGALAEGVARVLDSPELAGRLSRAGRAFAEGLDWSRLLPRWEAVLHRAAGGGG